MPKAKKTKRRSDGGKKCGRGKCVAIAVDAMADAFPVAEMMAARERLDQAPTIEQARARRELSAKEVERIGREIRKVRADVTDCAKAIERGDTELARSRWLCANESIDALCGCLEMTEADARKMDSILPKISEIVKNLPKSPAWMIKEAKFFARGARAAIRDRNRKMADTYLRALIHHDQALRKKVFI